MLELNYRIYGRPSFYEAPSSATGHLFDDWGWADRLPRGWDLPPR